MVTTAATVIGGFAGVAHAATPINTGQPFYPQSAVGTTVTPDFQGGTLRDNQNGVTDNNTYTVENFPTNTIDAFGHVTTFAGPFSGAGPLTITDSVGGGTLVVTGASAIGGTVTIDHGATMQWGAGGPAFLVGGGNAVVDNGALVLNFGGGGIGGAAPISGSGTVELQSGSLNDSGVSTYTGVTTIDTAGFLALSGAGSIAGSSNVIDNGTFDISGTAAGTSIKALTGSGGVSLGAQTLTLTAASGTFSGDLADGGLFGGTGGGLTIAGGTETLTGTNTFTGLTTINTGATLQLGAGGTTGTVAGAIVDNGLVQFNYSGSVTAPNAFSGGGSAEVVAGTLVVTGASAIGGTVTIDHGATMQWGAGGPAFLVGGGNAVVDNGALVLNFGGGGIGGAVPISGSGTVELQSGSLTDSGVSTYTGATTIDVAGFFNLSGGGSIAASSNVIDHGTFDISGTAGTSIKTLSGDGDVSLGAQTLTLTAASGTFSGDLADGGLFGGTGGGLTIAGGTETLTGTNTFTGLTTINTGATLQLGAGGTTGTVAGAIVDNGLVQFNYSGSVTAPNAFSGGGSAEVVAGALVVTGASAIGGTVTIDHGATMQWGAGGPAFLVGGGNAVVDNGALVLNFGGGGIGGAAPISGSGTVELQSGSLNDSGVSTYTGATTIDVAGFFNLSGGGSIAGSSNVIDNGTFDISGTAAGTSIKALTGSGGVSLGAQTLTLTAASGTFSGDLADGGLFGGTGGGLTIAGGTETLTGTNTFTGLTTINTGATLQLGAGGTTGTVAGAIVDNGLVQFNYSGPVTAPNAFSGGGSAEVVAGTLVVTGASAIGGTVTIDHGATMQWGAGGPAFLVGGGNAVVDNGALVLNFGGGGIGGAAPISGSGTVELQSGSLNDSGVSTYTGVTTIDTAGFLALSGAGSIAGSSNVIDNGTFDISGTAAGTSIKALTGSGGVSLGAQTLTLTAASGTFSGDLADGGLFGGTGGGLTIAGGTETLTGTNTFTGLTTINTGATLQLGGVGSIADSADPLVNGTFDISGSSGGVSVISLSGTGSVILGPNTLSLSNAADTFSGVISGAGGFTVAGGAETLTGTNTYLGVTTINTGATLQLGNGGTTGSVASTIINDSGLLIFDHSNPLTFGGVITQSGAVTIAGAGPVTFTGTNTYTGVTTINTGSTLQLGNGGTTGSVAGNITDNGLVKFDYSGAVTTPGTFTGTGSVEVVAGTAVVTGESEVGGTVTIDPGATLQWGGTTGFLTNTSLAVVDNGLLVAALTNGLFGAFQISGTGGVTVQSGLLGDEAVSTYTGATVIDAGATFLLSNPSGSIANSSGVMDNGTFDISNTVAGASVKTLAGSGLVSLGGETLTLTAAAGTFSGVIADGGNNNATGGALTIAGGTEILTGTNTYTGLTTINTGSTLQLGNGGTTGSVAGNITDNGLVKFDYSGAVTTPGTFTGTGSVEVVAGTAVVTGESEVGGTVTIDPGATLQWGGTTGFLTNTSLAVVDNGLLVAALTNGLFGAFQISGTGGVTVQSGLLGDEAVSTYTGATVIDAGATFLLSNPSGSIANSSGVMDNGTFDISNTVAGASVKTLAGSGLVSLGGETLTLTAAAGTFSGVIADGGNNNATGGALTIAGGTEILTGTNTYTGLTTINTGSTLQLGNGGATGAIVGPVLDNGALTFNRSGVLTLLNPISGTGALNQAGTGTTVLDAVNPFSGLTTVSGGVLEIGDSLHPGATLAGNVVVGAGGTLAGHGSIGGSVTNTAGGTVAPGGTIGMLTVGSYTQGAASTLAIEVSPTAASELNSLGPASLNGKLALTFDPGVYGPHIYEILAGAPVSGTFSSVVTSGSPGEAFGLFYAPNHSQVDLVTEATTNAQIYGGVSAATLDRAQDFASLVEDRFGDAGCADGSPGKAAADCGGFGAWAQAIGQTDHESGYGSLDSFTNTDAGVIGGIDRRWEGGSQVGVAFAYAQNNLNMSAAQAKASGAAYYGAIYGRWVVGPAWLDGEAFYMRNNWSVSRTVAGFGQAVSEPNNDTEGLIAEISAPLGDIRPYARFAFARTSRDLISEQGVGTLGYEINGGSATSALGELGVLYSHTFATSSGVQWQPGLQLGVQENGGNRLQTIVGSLSGLPGSGFSQSALGLAQTVGVVDGSLKVKLNDRFELFGDVRGRFGDRQTDGTASVGAIFHF